MVELGEVVLYEPLTKACRSSLVKVRCISGGGRGHPGGI